MSKSDKTDLTDILFLKTSHGMHYHIPAYALKSVLGVNTDMIHTAASAIMTAQNGTDYFTILCCNHTCCRITLKESINPLSAVIQAPDEGEYVTMTFEKGVPTSVNGKKMKVADIIATLNELGGKHGIGIIDIVENRVVGMKSRGVYETPGGTILYEAHQQLEELILDRETTALKLEMGNKFAQIVYEGKWFTPLREAVQAFIESTQQYVTGEVKFKLYKGNIIKAGTTSPYSLYNESIASFTTGDLYDHHDAEGFINLFGLSTKVRAMKMQEQGVLK